MENHQRMQPDRLKEALSRFAQLLKINPEAGSFSLVVAGGAGLVLNNRTKIAIATEDVDVIGEFRSGQLTEPGWDAEFKKARETVAVEMGLRSDWINSGPAELLDKLPRKFTTRLRKNSRAIKFGESLTVISIPRRDQILLKTYATLNMDTNNPKRKKHIVDLSNLEPTAEDIARGIQWATDNCEDFADDFDSLSLHVAELARDLEIYPPNKIEKCYKQL